jgi:hypothetical protein
MIVEDTTEQFTSTIGWKGLSEQVRKIRLRVFLQHL